MDGPLGETVPDRRPVTAHDLLTFTFGLGPVSETFAAARPWPIVAGADAPHPATLGPPGSGRPTGS